MTAKLSTFPSQRRDFVSTRVVEAQRYYLDLQPKPTRDITVVGGGCERVRADYEMKRRSYPYFTLEFVAEGEGRLALDGRTCRLRPGVAFAYGPGISHRIHTEAEHPMLKYYVNFVGQRAARLLKQSPVSPGKVVQVSALGEVRAIFESLQQSGTGETPYGPALCAAFIPVLLLKLAEKAVPYEAADPRALATYQRSRAYLEKHFLALKTLEEAARGSGVNLSYLCRLFQRFDHQTPYRYLLRLKMNRAAELLLDSGLLVKEVAAELGFSDPFNFSRTFKSCFGLAPEAFIRQGKRA